MVQRSPLGQGNVLKLRYGSIVIGCWNIHWNVHLLFKQVHTSMDISTCKRSAYTRLIAMPTWEHHAARASWRTEIRDSAQERTMFIDVWSANGDPFLHCANKQLICWLVYSTNICRGDHIPTIRDSIGNRLASKNIIYCSRLPSCSENIVIKEKPRRKRSWACFCNL